MTDLQRSTEEDQPPETAIPSERVSFGSSPWEALATSGFGSVVAVYGLWGLWRGYWRGFYWSSFQGSGAVWYFLALLVLGLALIMLATRSAWKKCGVTGPVLVLVFPLMVGFLFASILHADYNARPHKANCQNNLRQMGMVFKMYANESEGEVYPELSPKLGVLTVRSDDTYPGIYPEYLSDLNVLQCPDAASGDRSYFYLGYVIPDQETLERFAAAYRVRVAAGMPFDGDLDGGEADSALSVIRLRDDFHGESATIQAQSRIPVLVERFPNAHNPEGGNVAYMDGHVEWIRWGEKWPMTPEAMDVLLALDALGNVSPLTDAEQQ